MMRDQTIDALRQQMSQGRISARELTEYYLGRIAEYDGRLRAVIELNPDAALLAGQADAQRQAGAALGPLHGIPLLIKDNIDTAAPLTTTAGSLAMEGFVAAQEAFAVRCLREAGAIILGKTNPSEWANFRSTRSSSGWSSRGGQTRNPYVLERTPIGSSSGSGAAVAADFCAGAIGTETDGSIVYPASASSVVGLKPTVGLISRSGIIPISASQDTAGPMARTVADCAALLDVMAAPDPTDAATAAAAQRGGYARSLRSISLRSARIGILRSYFGLHERVDQCAETALSVLSQQGAELIDPLTLPHLDELGVAEQTLLHYEFKDGLNAYFAARPHCPIRSLGELIAFNEKHRERVMPYFGQERLLSAEFKDSLASPEYRQALRTCRRLSRDQGIDSLLRGHRLDALVAPTTGMLWLIDPVNGDHRTGGCARLAAVAGYPHITVPAGYALGLPVGLSFFSGAWQEAKLLALAWAYEQASVARVAPQFHPTTALI